MLASDPPVRHQHCERHPLPYVRCRPIGAQWQPARSFGITSWWTAFRLSR